MNKKTTVQDIKVRPEDRELLAEAARTCHISLPRYLSELAECKAAEIRWFHIQQAAAEEEAKAEAAARRFGLV